MSQYTSPHPEPVMIGVIGGSGVYKLESLENPVYYEIDTPYGCPSGQICVAQVSGVTCAFLPRHGPHHSVNPTEINYRANICAMKILGVRYLLSINAVGSLDENYKPGDLVVVDQLVDRTTQRVSTFFDKGVVAHVDFAYPVSKTLSSLAYETIMGCFPEVSGHPRDFTIHSSGTLVTMEGPQFSTRAESMINKHLGAHLIGMTSATEAKLAREAEMAYSIVAMVTDMDAWSDAPHVDVSAVMQVVAANGRKAQLYPPAIIKAIHANLFEDPAHDALRFAIMTKGEHISEDTKTKLAALLGTKYPQFSM